MIETYTGLEFDYSNPTPDQINVRDIATALARQPRFAGHTLQDYSVAQHSLLVAALVRERGARPELQLAALFHDGHEAYLCDLPTPLKDELRKIGGSAYDDMVLDVDCSVARLLGIDVGLFHHPMVKQADADALALEARALKQSRATTPHWDRVWNNASEDLHWPEDLDFVDLQGARGTVKGTLAFLAAHQQLRLEQLEAA